VVTLGGIGSCYASLTFKPQAFILATNCAITDFTKTIADLDFYYLFDRSNLHVLVLYVDDLILTGSLEKLITGCKADLAGE
jgi:hypothetical protein